MNIYENVLNFRGTWRTYQQRVLNHAEKYLADGKIHIVAAPGAGKTTLGIELIRRLGAPCLILSPSITIRQQWLARMQEGFLLPGQDPDAWFSGNIQNPRPLTAITYQALHSCMKRYAGILKEEDGDSDTEETVDYSQFDIYETIRTSGIHTICLDEAHHLRSEWWKALEEFLKNVPDAVIISLTATPPYDSTPAQWKRYIDLCGPIDEEIFAPELVKEGSLCPHQDYIYFNWPAEEELREVKEYTKRTKEIIKLLSQDVEFASIVAAHRGILSPEEYSEAFLDNPKYFSSILIFLHDRGIPFSPYLTELTGTKGHFPRLNEEWMETLLQGFLYDDTDAYPCDKVYREQLITSLKAAGCIRKNKVTLTKNEEINKLLVSSKGKLNSINDIVKAEYESMGHKLRLLVLCDYIKPEMLSSVGDCEKSTGEIGAVPIFENIRRQQIPGVRLGVLSGSVVIVPADTEEELHSLLLKYNCEGKLTPLGTTGYGKLNVKGSNHHIVSVITELFTRGRINVLTGTKSLLGEGWDSPCINSLILATYVGSFMLSNQMRGRAIRVFAEEPEKTGNIWHLACILPMKEFEGQEGAIAGDYETLTRRFDAFLGISSVEDVIESGIGRLGIDGKISSKREVEHCNKRMLKNACDRDGLRKAWDKSLKVIHDTPAVEEVEEVDKALLEPGYFFLNAVVLEVVSSIAAICFLLARIFFSAGTNHIFVPGFVISILLFLSVAGIFRYGFRIATLCTPQKRMKKAAQGILNALIQTGKLESPLNCRAETEECDIAVRAYLKGGSTRDKTLFAVCMAQFWGEIDNPRYLLMRKKRMRTGEYYTVPEVFGKKKEDALCFAHCMKKLLGPYEAVYTRTPEGRKILLKARTRSFVNKNERLLTGKKQVKSDFE